MKIALARASLFFVIGLCGCTPVVSVRPLFTPAEMEKPYLDQRVVGDWNMADPDHPGDDAEAKPPCRVNISQPTAGELPYAVEFHCSDEKSSSAESYSKYDLHLVSLGTNLE